MADTAGNIGYMHLTPSPIRGDSTPWLGSRVLDGTSSKWDWQGIRPIKDLPRSFNPKKGYIVTANNRQSPEHASNDSGAGPIIPARAIRIDEIIRTGIKEGKKFTAQDMVDIQQDTTDVFARQVVPKLLTAVNSVEKDLTQKLLADFKKGSEYLQDWEGSFSETDVAATVYSYWINFFYETLFHNQAEQE